MARVDLVEPYAVRDMRKRVKESMQAHGEEIILFTLYHSTLDRNAPRCPVCYDDIYSSSGDANCPACYGTGYENGYKAKFRSWAMLGVAEVGEDIKRRGEYMSTTGQVSLEGLPLVAENDIFARVRSWSQDHRPLEVEGLYRLDAVQVDSLRTGNVFGQLPSNSVGQRSRYSRLDDASPFYKMLRDGILDPQVPVPRYDGEPR